MTFDDKFPFVTFGLGVLIGCAFGLLLCSGCTAHASHVYADRVFTDDGHTYRAYRNDRAAIITHDGGCPHPMHRCRDTVYHYEVQTR